MLLLLVVVYDVKLLSAFTMWPKGDGLLPADVEACEIASIYVDLNYVVARYVARTVNSIPVTLDELFFERCFP